MNKYQRQVELKLLENEENCKKQLIANYKQALKDVKGKLKEMTKNPDERKMANIRYQLMIDAQLETILNQMGEKNVSDLTDYLKVMYHDGYLGCVYNIHKDGVGLVLQLDEKKIESVVFMDIKELKFSDRLYHNLDKLKQDFKTELARGLSTGNDYLNIASNLMLHGQSDLKQSFRIVTTEGHRVQSMAKMDAMHDAAAHGADVVKQWDSTIDSVTRATHRELDEQIREVDEAFEIPSTGDRAMYPGGFGIAREDIFCRCCLLQRARWALGDEEYKYSRFSNQIISIESDEYTDWKEKYLQKVVEIAKEDGKITDKDKRAIFDYMSFDSYKINEKLRDGKMLTKAEQQWVENLEVALDKMPSYSGNLSRSLQFWDEDTLQGFISEFHVGESVEFSQYISTTKGDSYNPDGQVQIFIRQAKSGKDISQYNTQEQEVLYQRNSKFDVLNKYESNGKTIIILEEKIDE